MSPIERVLSRLAEEANSNEQCLAGIAERLRYIAPDDPHRQVVDDIRTAIERRLTEAREEIAAITSLLVAVGSR